MVNVSVALLDTFAGIGNQEYPTVGSVSATRTCCSCSSIVHASLLAQTRKQHVLALCPRETLLCTGHVWGLLLTIAQYASADESRNITAQESASVTDSRTRLRGRLDASPAAGDATRQRV
jgi:hypothetical protein